MERKIFTVNDINKYIKNLITSDENLKYVFVKGEISNCKIAATGHIYFSIKDSESKKNEIIVNYDGNYVTYLPKDLVYIK
mgnify:CR=1 FL=1